MIEQVDIIISTKNRINDLIFTLNHMLNMGFREEQIHITDDGSSDETYTTIKNKFPEVNIIQNNESLGYIKNRTDLMLTTQRNFILSLDDDSHIRTKEDIEEAIVILKRKKEYGIFHFKVFHQLKEPPLKNTLDNKFKIVRSYIGCGHIIKREVVDSLGGYLNELFFYGEELEYSLRAYKKGYYVISQENLIVHHRVDKEERKNQTVSVQSKGIYSTDWRIMMIYSNNLIITALYYPVFLDFIFIIYRTLISFKNVFIKQANPLLFFKIIKRFFSFSSIISKRKERLSYKELTSWLKLDDFPSS